MKKSTLDIIGWIGLFLILFIGVVLMCRYGAYTSWTALHCDYNHTTHELISCK